MIEVKIEAIPGSNVRRVVGLVCTECEAESDHAYRIQYRASADVYRAVFGTVSGMLALGPLTVGDETKPVLFCTGCDAELDLSPEVDALAHGFASENEFKAAVDFETAGDTFRVCACTEETLETAAQIRWRTLGAPVEHRISLMGDASHEAEAAATPSIRGWFKADTLVLRCPLCDGSLLRKVSLTTRDGLLTADALRSTP